MVAFTVCTIPHFCGFFPSFFLGRLVGAQLGPVGSRLGASLCWGGAAVPVVERMRATVDQHCNMHFAHFGTRSVLRRPIWQIRTHESEYVTNSAISLQSQAHVPWSKLGYMYPLPANRPVWDLAACPPERSQNWGKLPILGDGHQSINRDIIFLYIYSINNPEWGRDDHSACTMSWRKGTYGRNVQVKVIPLVLVLPFLIAE